MVFRRVGRRLAGPAKKVVKWFVIVQLVTVGISGVVYAFWMFVPRSPPPGVEVPSGSFAFAAFGDAPYSAVEFRLFDVVLEDLTEHDLTFAVHVGDIFSEPCLDDAYRRTRDEFNRLPHPVVYTPGDNEWTDCYAGSEESDPYSRLSSIRDILYPDASVSLGGRTIGLSHQGLDPQHGEFLENARWVHEGIVFSTVHLVGSFNARRAFPGQTDLEAEEPSRRTEAAAAWVSEAFAAAQEMDAIALVLAFHANVFFEDAPDAPRRLAFEPFLETLEERVKGFDGPVLAIHGDWHDYIVDHPLADRGTGETLENFTRLQVPGSPAVGWVHVTVTPGADELFSFEPRVVSRWPW